MAITNGFRLSRCLSALSAWPRGIAQATRARPINRARELMLRSGRPRGRPILLVALSPPGADLCAPRPTSPLRAASRGAMPSPRAEYICRDQHRPTCAEDAWLARTSRPTESGTQLNCERRSPQPQQEACGYVQNSKVVSAKVVTSHMHEPSSDRSTVAKHRLQ